MLLHLCPFRSRIYESDAGQLFNEAVDIDCFVVFVVQARLDRRCGQTGHQHVEDFEGLLRKLVKVAQFGVADEVVIAILLYRKWNDKILLYTCDWHGKFPAWRLICRPGRPICHRASETIIATSEAGFHAG